VNHDEKGRLMRFDSMLDEAAELEWQGYAEDDVSAAHVAGPQMHNAGVAAAGPGHTARSFAGEPRPKAAQNTGIAAVGPGPGFSPQGSGRRDETPVSVLASVSDLIGTVKK
jgi:hypothetical protein